MNRRAAASLMSAGLLSATVVWPRFGHASGDTPLLATPEQIDAEKQLLLLLKDPALKLIQAELRAELAATPRGHTTYGAATLDNAIAEWTNSLLFAELSSYRPSPAVLWTTDDTSRTWLGHTLGGVGTSGDNPDAVYRIATIDGGGRYEVLGRLEPSHRPAQVVLELHAGSLIQPPKFDPSSHDLAPVAGITDRDLVISADGTFRITIGGPAGGPNHLTPRPGVITFGVRDMLSDWNQRPCRLAIHRIDGEPPQAFDSDGLRQRAQTHLGPFIRYWSAFPDSWLGGLKPNTVTKPMGRNGGWGFVAGLRYQLAPGEGIVVTTSRGDAGYTGFQLTDPWMIAPDARRYQASLNRSQTQFSADGSSTYVIAPTDPGVANWLDTAGLHEGYGIIRWQATPPGATSAELLRDFRVTQISDVAGMPGVARVSPRQRAAQLAARVESYNSRVR